MKKKEEKITYPNRQELVRIDSVEYKDGVVLYDLNYTDEDGHTVSDGLFDEVEVIAKLLHLMQVTVQDPRFYIRKNQS